MEFAKNRFRAAIILGAVSFAAYKAYRMLTERKPHETILTSIGYRPGRLPRGKVSREELAHIRNRYKDDRDEF